MAQKARGQLCTGQSQLARKQPGCGHTDWQSSGKDSTTLRHTEQIPAEVPMLNKASVPRFPASGILV